MNTEIKDFIEKNINLIEQGRFEELYDLAITGIIGRNLLVGKFTETFLGADIDPAEYMREIPPFYLNGAETIKYYVIPDNAISIGNHAFCHCPKLKGVTIGNSVTSIGKYAFANCHSLPSITIPESVTAIENLAFLDCENLSRVVLSSGIKQIGAYVFANTTQKNKGLKSINYLGTRAQWNKIKLDAKWKDDSYIEKIECKDGVIDLNNK